MLWIWSGVIKVIKVNIEIVIIFHFLHDIEEVIVVLMLVVGLFEEVKRHDSNVIIIIMRKVVRLD